jgi:hypothetical protein
MNRRLYFNIAKARGRGLRFGRRGRHPLWPVYRAKIHSPNEYLFPFETINLYDPFSLYDSPRKYYGFSTSTAARISFFTRRAKKYDPALWGLQLALIRIKQRKYFPFKQLEFINK